MKYKAIVSDFDGTLVTKDILDVVCGITGKEAESQKINEEFHNGIRTSISESIIPRINFLFPKNGIEYFADYVIKDDLSKAIPLIEKLNS